MRSAHLLALGLTSLLLVATAARASTLSADTILSSKHLVKIAGGRRINLVCSGRGAPTVVFEFGLGANLLTWQKVAVPVTRSTRACFYDRAGYGYSDAPRGPSTADQAVADLHQVLRRSRVRLPVILVGHSVGGLYSTLYADRYSADLAGLVLIDPSYAEQDKGESPDELAKDASSFSETITHLRACSGLARSGKLATERHPECFAFSPERTPEQRAFLTYQMIRPDRYDAMASEIESQHSTDGRSDINSRQELGARRNWGEMPVVVLTAALVPDPKVADADRALAERNWGLWKAGHDALAARSTRGRSAVVPKTGHFIQVDQPQAVIDAIENVIAASRAKP
ncbi:alpha/beta hydrolase [Sphingosinicellaceae bacterium]|nr:alpha/beta hydrolase [Sphingosinicellaceae bacterium]